jgi:hypothetical protein
MSFRAYLDNVKAKTCKTPRQLKDLAAVVVFTHPAAGKGDRAGR